MNEIFQGVVEEFSDLSGVQAAQLATRLVVAGVLGGALGWERERAGKAAGFRTHILVAVGAAAFVAVPQQSGMESEGMGGVFEGLIAGIGFLGAGCILKSEADERVRGLTTAAGLWLTAAVGAAAGTGREASALLIGGAGFFTLTVLNRWDIRSAIGATEECKTAGKGKTGPS